MNGLVGVIGIDPLPYQAHPSELRNGIFLEQAEEKDLNTLNGEDVEDLQAAIDCVWPGAVELGMSDLTKAAFAFAGFAIGIGIHP